MHGLVVSIEGIDTAGKTTQAEALAYRLRQEGYDVELFHFPMYERPVGAFIGDILNGRCVNCDKKISLEAMQMLYVADQLDFQEELKAMKKAGKIVILDRYDLSTLAYYSMAQDKDIEDAMNVVYGQWQKVLMKPDLTVVLNLDHEEIAKRKVQLDLFEKDAERMKRASEAYMQLALRIRDRSLLPIDAHASIQDINEQIYKEVIRLCQA